jgi:orotidine-5'-phosphate decarboxylase
MRPVRTLSIAASTPSISPKPPSSSRSIAGGPKPAVGGIKLGLEFFLAHGAPGVRYAFPTPVRATGVGFFLDLKLHDIPNTVAGGIRAVVELAPTFITIHASGGRRC